MSQLGRHSCALETRNFATDTGLKWTDTDSWEEMRTAAGTRKKAQPKTWASTHGIKPFEHGTRKPATRAPRTHINPSWKLTPHQQAKEAKLQELERDLEPYSYKSPAGPAYLPGSQFLLPVLKLQSSSIATDKQGESSKAGERLKAPSLAYTGDYDEACDLLSCLGRGPMGLDLEWNVSRYAGALHTALLQICTPSLILIIHLSSMNHRTPPPLKAILEDPRIIKTGVAIKNDALKLQREFGIDTRNVVELSNMAKLAQPQLWAGHRHLVSLRDLTRIYLGKRLDKGAVRVSDWEAYPLAHDQIQYAASDTFVGLELLRAISEYFKPSQSHSRGESAWILERLGQHTSDDNNNINKADNNMPMDLEQALKLSSNDLYRERIQQDAADRQKASLQTALREIQPTNTPAQKGTPKVAAKDKAKNKVKEGGKVESDDEIQVTRVLLAHDRAMQRWLYSQQTLTEIASASKIKVSTTASYVIKALFEAKAQRQDGNGLLEDFKAEDRLRLERELKELQGEVKVARGRYRTLAKSLGWVEVVSNGESESEGEAEGNKSPSPAGKGSNSLKGAESPQDTRKKASPPTAKWSPSPRGAREDTKTTSAAAQKWSLLPKGAEQRKGKSIATLPEKWSEVDVVDTSR